MWLVLEDVRAPKSAFPVGWSARLKSVFSIVLLAGLYLFATTLVMSAQEEVASPWTGVSPSAANKTLAGASAGADKSASFNLDHSAMRSLLGKAPAESKQLAVASQSVITLPMPDGSEARFRFVDSPVMAPELAAKFPQIKTYLGQGVDDAQATVRFDLTPAGFHAQILSPRGAVYVEPQGSGETNVHTSYYKRDYAKSDDTFQCLSPANEMKSLTSESTPSILSVSSGQLRTYRLACAATAQYTQFQGGSVAAGLAAIVTAINRVSGIYETELGIRLVLVANNDRIIYTNTATQPYNNSSPSALLSQNQSNIDYVIGAGNYDVGHVFSTAGGGMASLGVVCVNGSKARGETGMSSPVGDAFYVDYVAHEMGHQFGANHTFNSTTGSCGGGNRNAATAIEPGSGSTIMAYAGICGADNLQAHSDPYFHSVSLGEILAYTTSGNGNGCATTSATGNSAPTVSTGGPYVIPANTPFALAATASDPDGDALTYCWEERDFGPAAALNAADNGSSPLFRSCAPSSSPQRCFPQLATLLAQTASTSEQLPSTDRILQFRVTVRDNRSGGGAFATADTQVVIVTNAAPFAVTGPLAGTTVFGSTVVTWNVAGTTNDPVGAATVNILLSTNGGLDFPITLAANVPNNGQAAIPIPTLTTTNARVKVEAVGNIFFSISPGNFSLVPSVPAIALAGAFLAAENGVPANGLVDASETVLVNIALKNIGTANAANLVATLLATNGVASPSTSQNFGALVAGGSSVSRPFVFTANAACGSVVAATLHLQDGARDLGLITNYFGIGSFTSTTRSATNSSKITIRDLNSASPYPAAITLAGLTGYVSKVTVTLRNFTHPYPADADVLLVGPAGQKVLLVSDAGASYGVTNINLTLDDTAAATIPEWSKITAGSWKPTNYDTNTDSFPAPAPAGPYATALSTFNGTSPNGKWSLYIEDDGPNDSGSIAQGWTLTITTTNPVCTTGTTNNPALQAPSLAPIPNRVVYAGTTLLVTNSATAGGSQSNNVVFSLDPGAPASASIDPASGLLRWAVSDGASSTNQLTVRVANPQSPSLTDAKSFTVSVLPLPTVSTLVRSNGVVKLGWGSVVGQTYRVQFTDSFQHPVWQDLTANLTATNTTVSVSDSGASVPQRFYRLVVVSP